MVKLTATEAAKQRSKMVKPDVSGDEAMVVLKDVTYGIEPKDSKLIYTAAMLRYREEVEIERAGQPKGFINSAPDL